jgi:hypothetical protein
VAITCTAGNYLVAIGQGAGGAPAGIILSFSDTGSNTYTIIDNVNGVGGTFGGACAYAPITTGGAITVSVTFSGTPSTRGIVVREYSGWAASTPLDQHVVSAYTTTGSISSGASAATTQANEDVVGWTAFSATTITVGAGYGNFGQTATTIGAAGEDLTVSATGAQTATFNSTGLSAYICGVATFKLASSSSVDTSMMFGV